MGSSQIIALSTPFDQIDQTCPQRKSDFEKCDSEKEIWNHD
jgi:hypothetical protein